MFGTSRQIGALVKKSEENYVVLVPEGPYQHEMQSQLREAGIPEQQYRIVPMLAVWQDDLQDRENLEDVFFNPEHHFVLFHTSWELQLMWRLLRPAGIKVDCF